MKKDMRIISEDQQTEEFETGNEDDFEDPDGSKDDYDNIDISEYVRDDDDDS